LALGLSLSTVGAQPGTGKIGGPVQDIVDQIGAYELTPEMINKAIAQEEKDQKKMGEFTEAIGMLKQGGLDLTGDAAARIKESPEKVQEAMDETIAEATVLGMYQQVPCDICKSLSEVLSADLQSNWKPAWSEEKLLSHVQAFCESAAIPGEHQVVAKKRKEGQKGDKYYVERGMTGVKIFTTPYSEQVFRRVCKEDVDENDVTLAEIAAAKLPELTEEFKKANYGDHLQRVLEPEMCRKKCKAAKAGKGGKKKAANKEDL
jgi:hypothetical protein